MTEYKVSRLRHRDPVREITAEQLGLDPERVVPLSGPIRQTTNPDHDATHWRVKQVVELIGDFGGVILTGPPGTGKTYWASEIAKILTGNDQSRMRFIQFHPSYQYEDFVQGFVPSDGTFVLREKHLMEMCRTASLKPGQTCVMVIDEMSRCDPGRVFGEALTYIERSRRDIPFRLASTTELIIPGNLVFIATMNPNDRGVDEVDAALERRFAKMPMEPDVEELRQILTRNGMDPALKERVVTFFKGLLQNTNPRAVVGHAYFNSVRDEASLRRLWTYQLQFHMTKAFRLDPEGLREMTAAWESVLKAESQAEARA